MKFIYNDGGRAAAGYKGTAGDCVCRAIAIATGKPYQEVYDALNEAAGRERLSKRHRGKSSARDGVHRPTIRRFMESLGWEWIPTMKIGQGCKTHLADGELPSGRLVVSVSRHLTAVIDGVINDTHDPQREDSYMFEPDHGQMLKKGQGRNENGVWTKIGGRCVYGYFRQRQPKPSNVISFPSRKPVFP